MQRSNDIKKEQSPEFGKPYQGNRKHSKFDLGEDLTVIPVEIEIDYCLYNMIEREILEKIRPASKVSFEEWVNICFKERMQQILTDPKEFGKLILLPLRQAHCIPEPDLRKEEA